MRAAFDFCVHWHYKVIQCTLSCHTELVFWWIWVRYRRRQNRIFSEVTKLNRIRLVIRCFGDHLRIWAAYDLATCWCNRHQGAQKHLPLTYSAYHREHWRTVRITGNTNVVSFSNTSVDICSHCVPIFIHELWMRSTFVFVFRISWVNQQHVNLRHGSRFVPWWRERSNHRTGKELQKYSLFNFFFRDKFFG